MTLAEMFSRTIETARIRLCAITEEQACESWSPGKWTRKQVLGHLIDSASNNHQRFVRGAIDGTYDGPDYKQQAWVDIHGYNEMRWDTVVGWWTVENEILTRVVGRIPESAYGSECKVEGDAPVSLRALIEDYLRHMQHHIDQL